MLEDCADLPACEITLSEAAKSVRFLGEIPLSDRDIEILPTLYAKNNPEHLERDCLSKDKNPDMFRLFSSGYREIL